MPLTELEVVTLAFAILNTLTSAFWWYKPLNVLCPIELDVLSPPTPVAPKHTPTPALVRALRPSLQVALALAQPRLHNKKPKEPFRHRLKAALGSGRGHILSWFEDVFSGVEQPYGLRGLSIFLPTLRGLIFVCHVVAYLVLSVMFILVYGILLLPHAILFCLLPHRWFSAGQGQHTFHVGTFYTMELPEHESNLALDLACLVGMGFGGIHFLSWNSPFPTPLESLLWRISSIILIVEPVLVILRPDSTDIPFRRKGLISKVLAVPRVLFGKIGALLGFNTFIGPLAYALARLCILVLAILTLRSIPSDDLKNVPWTSYIPHL
ncbi:hypothetical protein BDN72DRAFT_896419 [Pluteus cervinus]|uniref:Uncharacterized protein n=1 Tax=Pluteus cervinus TaxID=181527 RepID=A0ACD3AY24_9AGAR|nr:hypothetical protein BDN72DRAFT_896419 [Pluteus cervinus]